MTTSPPNRLANRRLNPEVYLLKKKLPLPLPGRPLSPTNVSIPGSRLSMTRTSREIDLDRTRPTVEIPGLDWIRCQNARLYYVVKLVIYMA